MGKVVVKVVAAAKARGKGKEARGKVVVQRWERS
jgi:hypothetical protein